MSDLVDEFRNWEHTHNRDNYGRYDAYKAGYMLAHEELRAKLREAEAECAGYREILAEISRLLSADYWSNWDLCIENANEALSGDGGKKLLRVVEACRKYIEADELGEDARGPTRACYYQDMEDALRELESLKEE